MTTITLFNHKGGTGKSTTTVNLACSLARQGYRVAMIDLDAQANLSDSYFDYSPTTDIVSCFRRGIATGQTITSEDFTQVGDNLWLLPNLKNITEGLFYELFGGQDDQKQRHLFFTYLLSQLEAFDYLLIDTPPNLENRSISAIIASDFLLIPTLLEKTSLDNVSNVLTVVEHLTNQYQLDPIPTGLVYTRVDRISKWLNASWSRYAQELNLEVLGTIYKSSDYAYSPHCPAYYGSGKVKLDHDNLSKNLIKLCQKTNNL